MGDKGPTFNVISCKTGQGGKIWTSMYEPSTTGWGEPDEIPMIKFFTTKAAANAHAKQRLKKRLANLRKDAEEGCYGSDSEGESNDDGMKKPPKEKWPLVPSSSLFVGDFPKGKRSKLFGK